MRRNVFLVLLALVLALSVGLVACGEEEEEEETCELTISSTAGGSVINPGEGTFTRDKGEVVNIVAEREEGYRFVNWTGDVSTIANVTAASTTITMGADYAISANFQAEVIKYDFVAEASADETKWGSRTPAVDLYDPLPFPGATDDNMGFACYRTNVVLEDNLTYDRVLETHPRWVDDGVIRGEYYALRYTNYEVGTHARFYAKVGFLKGATAGNVTFLVAIVMRDEPFPVVHIAEITDAYDGSLRTIDVDLSPYAGKKAWFYVEVHANGKANQDWAVWVEAKIIL